MCFWDGTNICKINLGFMPWPGYSIFSSFQLLLKREEIRCRFFLLSISWWFPPKWNELIEGASINNPVLIESASLKQVCFSMWAGEFVSVQSCTRGRKTSLYLEIITVRKLKGNITNKIKAKGWMLDWCHWPFLFFSLQLLISN